MYGKPMVSSLSMSFKKATNITEDREEAKKQHRATITTLINQYLEDVESGKAVGIRNAKDLVEVMKMDLLLMGEATERTENSADFDEIRVQKISQAIDLNDPAFKGIVSKMFSVLNEANDEADIGTNKKTESDDLAGLNGASLVADADAVAEISRQFAQQAMDMGE